MPIEEIRFPTGEPIPPLQHVEPFICPTAYSDVGAQPIKADRVTIGGEEGRRVAIACPYLSPFYRDSSGYQYYSCSVPNPLSLTRICHIVNPVLIQVRETQS